MLVAALFHDRIAMNIATIAICALVCLVPFVMNVNSTLVSWSLQVADEQNGVSVVNCIEFPLSSRQNLIKVKNVKKMQHPVLTSISNSAGSIYPLRVRYEALEAVGS